MPPKKRMTKARQEAKERTFKKASEKDRKLRGFYKPIELGAKGVVKIDGVNVDFGQSMPTWDMEGERWHLNVRYGNKDFYHVTSEGTKKMRYWFKSEGGRLVGGLPASNYRSSVGGTHHMFGDLPDKVKLFVERNWSELLGGV
ncbi:hypothetical protein [Lentzea sp. NEAU-D7]|uniref:hypothetical protein n=1 Tax=Lentzea sp. NEAU-D7 TaxID=2994667 RepID=UPI00224B2F2F|nr:hypothetical protein [Lentzea sp. NEAU-D7]MCX2954538.1 hypothetical protein [Lentzea sp. NEAU-D7]